jgi:hypothetical protein
MWHKNNSSMCIKNKFDDIGSDSALKLLMRAKERMSEANFGSKPGDAVLIMSVVHVFGDLAQPLHVMNLVGNYFSPMLNLFGAGPWQTDYGGNLIPIKSHSAKCTQPRGEGCLPIEVNQSK